MVDGPRGSSLPGLDLEATGPQGMRMSMLRIIVKDRVYQLMFLRLSENAELFQQFLSSFSLR